MPKETFAPKLLAHISQAVYPESYPPPSIHNLQKLHTHFEILAAQNNSFQPAVDWFAMTSDFVRNQTSKDQRLKQMVEFCINNKFIVNGKLQDPFGPGYEVMDQTDPILCNFAHQDYWKVKKSLASPTPQEIQAFLRKQTLNSDLFTQRDSLLLKPLQQALQEAFSTNPVSNLRQTALELGVAKCETAVRLAFNHNLVLVDLLSPEVIAENFRQSWKSLHPNIILPRIIFIDPNTDPSRTSAILKAHQHKDSENVSIIIGGLDITKQPIPIEPKSVDAAGCIYVAHHLDNNSQNGQTSPRVQMVQELLRVSKDLPIGKKPVAIVDGLRSLENLLNTILPILAETQAYATGFDAIVSHARGTTPEESLLLGNKASPNIPWKTETDAPNLNPLITPQLVTLRAF